MKRLLFILLLLPFTSSAQRHVYIGDTTIIDSFNLTMWSRQFKPPTAKKINPHFDSTGSIALVEGAWEWHNGTEWVPVAGDPAATIYNSDGQLSTGRTVDANKNDLSITNLGNLLFNSTDGDILRSVAGDYKLILSPPTYLLRSARYPIKKITVSESPYTVDIADDIILVDATTGNIDIILPAATSVVETIDATTTGKTYTVVRIGGTTNVVTVSVDGGDINGAHSIDVPRRSSAKFYPDTDSADWWSY